MYIDKFSKQKKTSIFCHKDAKTSNHKELKTYICHHSAHFRVEVATFTMANNLTYFMKSMIQEVFNLCFSHSEDQNLTLSLSTSNVIQEEYQVLI